MPRQDKIPVEAEREIILFFIDELVKVMLFVFFLFIKNEITLYGMTPALSSVGVGIKFLTLS